MKRLLTFIVLATLSPVLRAAPNCTVEGLTRGCKELSDKGWTQYITLADDTWFRNPEYDNSIMAKVLSSNLIPRSVSTERQKKLQDLVDFAKNTIISELKAGRPDDKLPAEVKNQISRIAKVRYSYEDSVNDHSTICSTFSPNAYYRFSKNKLVLCRSTMMLPDDGLIAVIGHEICHSIDPCSLTYDADSIPALETESLPYSTQLACLRERKLADYFPRTEAEYTAAATKNAAEGTAPAEILNQIPDVKAHPSCYSPINGTNPGNESIPDLCGGRVAAKYIKANPPKNAMERLSILSPFLERLCGRPVVEPHLEGHMSTRERLDKIFLADPDMSEALGCVPVHESCWKPPSLGSSIQKASATSH